MLFSPCTEPAAWSQLCERCITLMEFSWFFYLRLGKSTVGLHLISNPLVTSCPCWKMPSCVLHLPSPLTLTSSLSYFRLCWFLAAAVLCITTRLDPGASCASSKWSNTLGRDAKGLCSQDCMMWPPERPGTGLGCPQS